MIGEGNPFGAGIQYIKDRLPRRTRNPAIPLARPAGQINDPVLGFAGGDASNPLSVTQAPGHNEQPNTPHTEPAVATVEPAVLEKEKAPQYMVQAKELLTNALAKPDSPFKPKYMTAAQINGQAEATLDADVKAKKIQIGSEAYTKAFEAARAPILKARDEKMTLDAQAANTTVDAIKADEAKRVAAIYFINNTLPTIGENGVGKIVRSVTENGMTFNETRDGNLLPQIQNLLNQLGGEEKALAKSINEARRVVFGGKQFTLADWQNEFKKVPGNSAKPPEVLDKEAADTFDREALLTNSSPQTQTENKLTIEEERQQDWELSDELVEYLQSPFFVENKNAELAERSRQMQIELFIARYGATDQRGNRPLTVVALKHAKDFLKENHPPGATEMSFRNFKTLDNRTKALDGARSEERITELNAMATANTIDDAGKLELANAQKAELILSEAKEYTIKQLKAHSEGKDPNWKPSKVEEELLKLLYSPDEHHKLHTGEVIACLFADASFENPKDFGKALNTVDVLRAKPDVVNLLTADRDIVNMILSSSLGNQKELREYFQKNPGLLTPAERGFIVMLKKYQKMFGGALLIGLLGAAPGLMNTGVVDPAAQGQPG